MRVCTGEQCSAVQLSHATHFRCEAENGVGQKVVDQIKVKVACKCYFKLS